MSATERLYYTDSYLTTFEATALEYGEIDGRPCVVLDRSAFYPTSGGQPFDTGVLADRRVLEVIDREDDGAVVHVLDAPLIRGAEALPPDGPDVAAGLQPRDAATGPGRRVAGAIDWPRRFDHMQQHSGQHVLSAAFVRTAHLPTVSFHLGAEVCTIDLAGTADVRAIEAAEDAANRVVWENRPVTVRFVAGEDALKLPLRKAPARGGTLRIVEVEDWDLSACGGTHVPRTGVVGAIAVQAWEKYKGGTRVSFLCGGRVIGRFRGYRDVVSAAVRQLSIQSDELPAAVARLQADARELRQQLKALEESLAGYEADGLARAAEPRGPNLVVCRVIQGRDANGLKRLAQAIAARSRHVALLVSDSHPAQVVAARALDADVDVSAAIKALVTRFGGRGGGKQEAAQGGGLDARPEVICDAARDLLA